MIQPRAVHEKMTFEMVVSMEIGILDLTQLKRKIKFDYKLERGVFRILFSIPITMSGLILFGIGCTSSP